jgi:hypothetical protein
MSLIFDKLENKKSKFKPVINMKNNQNSNFLRKSKIKISIIFTVFSVLILLIIDVSLFALRDFRQSNFHPPKYLIEKND